MGQKKGRNETKLQKAARKAKKELDEKEVKFNLLIKKLIKKAP